MYHRAIAGVALAALLAAAAQADEKPDCRGAAIGAGRVANIIDGRTLKLTDGREVRLGGIEVPGDGAVSAATRTALEALASGREVSLLRMGEDKDRYGRVVALVAAQPLESGPPIQQMLLAQGHARVSAAVGNAACAAAFSAAEQTARAGHLGLWADASYLTKSAEDPGAILAVRGQFAVVEGKVVSVRESGGTIYVNFGRRWSDDFTVTVLKRNERGFTAAGRPLKNLAGRHVRVRGTIEERGGPWIEAAHPEQIEIAERN